MSCTETNNKEICDRLKIKMDLLQLTYRERCNCSATRAKWTTAGNWKHLCLA